MTTITETTDAPANTNTPYTMDVGDYFHGRLDIATDIDMISVKLTPGTQYTFAMTGLDVDDYVIDPYLALLNSNENQIRVDESSGPNTYSTFTYTPLVISTFFLKVESYSSVGFVNDGDYGISVVEGDLASYDAEMAASVLNRGAYFEYGDTWTATAGTGTNITWGARDNGPAVDADGVAAPFSQLTSAQIDAMQMAFDMYAEVSGLTFSRKDGNGGYSDEASILVGNYDSIADGERGYAHLPSTPNPTESSDEGDIWLNTKLSSTTSLPFGSQEFHTLLHQLGHSLGLRDASDYPTGSLTYANEAQFIQDSQQYTVMSSFDESNTGASYDDFAQTLMVYDMYVLQQMYGANMTTRTGKTTYGYNSNAGDLYNFSINNTPALTIWDAGGTDELDVSGYLGDQVIDIREGAYSSVLGYTNNIGIAYGAVIEDVESGGGDDTIYGNGSGNILSVRLRIQKLNERAGYDSAVIATLRRLSWSGHLSPAHNMTEANNVIQVI